jgi:dTDP-4-dehydrorhamnose reductase
MAIKVAILGSTGQLGTELVREFGERGYEVAGWDRAELDITCAEDVEKTIGLFAPHVVVNAAAYNQVDVAETEPLAALEVNALAVRNVALACRQSDALLVHFSTDYVFDGTKGQPYTEEDQPRPLGAYAVSKYAGELYAQAYLEAPLVIRTSGVFGPGGLRTARGNFLELMLRLAQSGQPVRVVEDMVASPTYAPALAGRTVDLVRHGVRGVIHVGGGRAISWHEYARLIFREAGLSPELRPIHEREYRTPARRPKYSALSNAKVDRLGLKPMPPLEEAIRRYLVLRERMLAQR